MNGLLEHFSNFVKGDDSQNSNVSEKISKVKILIDFVSNRLEAIGVLIFHIATNLSFWGHFGIFWQKVHLIN